MCIPSQVSPRSRGTPPLIPSTPHYPSNDQEQHSYAVLETTRSMANAFRRVDSCGTLDSSHNHALVMPVERKDALAKNAFRRVDSCGTLDAKKYPHIPATMVQDVDALANKNVNNITTYDQMRRTKSTGSASWNAQVRDGHFHKRRSPPALARRTSPLVNQQQEQQPIYHVLQQPTSPIYHVLQQPSPSGCPRSPSYSHFQQHEDFTFSEPAMSKTSSLQRPASAGPQGRYRASSSSSRDGHVPPPTSRSIPSEISLLRSDVEPADCRPESLV